MVVGSPAQSAAVLVVEDEPLVRLVTAERLRDHGFNVIEAVDGEDAIGILQAKATRVDLVFSDIQMPRVDGIGLAEWLRDNIPAMPLLLTTANPMALVWSGQGVVAPVLLKPYSFATIVLRIHKMLAAAHGAPS